MDGEKIESLHDHECKLIGYDFVWLAELLLAGETRQVVIMPSSSFRGQTLGRQTLIEDQISIYRIQQKNYTIFWRSNFCVIAQAEIISLFV